MSVLTGLFLLHHLYQQHYHKHISYSTNNIVTIIAMPTGLFSPTSGDAMVGGHSIREGMDQVKDLMNLT